MLFALLLLAATPRPTIEGLDKPKNVQVGKLGKSENATGTVTIRCVDVGKSSLVEINDPGLMGAKDAWLRKKTGEVMPPCDANDAEVTRVEGLSGFGYVAGTKGEFIFANSADGFGDRLGLRVFSTNAGVMLLDVERSMQKPATLTTEGTSLWLRYHEALPATCDPVGPEAAKCWKQLREDAKIPEAIAIKAPPCEKELKGKNLLPGSALLAVPVEVDLNAPKTSKRFRAGDATCALAP